MNIGKIILPQSLVKFLIVGCLNTLINYFVYIFLIFISFNYLISSTIGFLSGSVTGFYFNTTWSFNQNHKLSLSFFCKYFIIQIFCLLINILIVYFVKNNFNINIYLYQIISIIILTIINYTLLKKILYSNDK